MAEKNRIVRHAGLAVAFGSLLMLGACTTGPAPYGPMTAGKSTGYTDEQLTDNRYRITFTGNSMTERQTVENYLLLRSAQVTLHAGYHWFMFGTRNTKANTTYMSTFTGWPGWGGYGWYWHNWAWGPPFGAPYNMDMTSRPITRYQAYAEIVLLTDAQAKMEPTAINAHQIIQHLQPPPPPPPPPPSSPEKAS